MAACEVRHLVQGPDGAPPLVFLNSLGAELAMWDPQAAAFDQDFRVVRYDARGHGSSPVPRGPYWVADLGGDAIALLDRLGIERASLCGVSLGGATAMWVAAHAPERVERLVVCCSSAFFGGRDAYMERAALVRAEGAEVVADAVVRRWFTAAMFEDRPADAARMRAMIAATPAEGYAASAEAVATADLRADLASIAAPTLVIAGAEDQATPPEHGRRAAAGIAGAEFAEVLRGAHLASFERPETVNELIRAHLLRGGPGGRPVSNDDRERGMRVRREVLGDDHVDRAEARKTEFSADFQEFITRYAWGEVWDRPDLPRRDRSIATLAVLVALRAENEIAMHVRAALRNGLTPVEIKEVILHTALYAGLPAANAAFAIAQEVVDAER